MDQDGETWFVARDVCSILDISDIGSAMERLDDDEAGKTLVENTRGQMVQSFIINESGLYSLIMRSNKAEAKPFRKWVTSVVLPTIRKTGGFKSLFNHP